MSVRYSKHLPIFVFLSDVLLLNSAFFFCHFIHVINGLLPNLITLIVINICWMVVSLLTKNYVVYRPLILRDNINRFMLTLAYNLVLFFGIIYFFQLYNTSRLETTVGYSLFFVMVLTHRSGLFFFLDYIRKKGYNHRQIAILGDQPIATRLLNSFNDHPEYGYDLIEYLSEQQLENISSEELIKRMVDKRPDELFICYKEINAELLDEIIKIGELHSIQIKVVSDLNIADNHATLHSYDQFPILQLRSHTGLPLKVRVLKRGFDLGFSCSVMIFGSPVFVLLYLITKFSSKGPAFFKQERIGRNGKPFNIYKFRSMYIDAEKFGPQLSRTHDPRITKWGRVIRKTRLDELPQFWNVFKGDMSVVGPRPERQHFIEKIVEKAPSYRKLLRVKPGITSIGQVHYGYAENVDQMRDRVRYDLIYLRKISLNSDLDIIFKTVKVMVQGKGK